MSIFIANDQVTKSIQRGTAPFLGLLGETLSPEAKFAIEVATIARPTVADYVSYLNQYPALFAVNLTTCLMQGMGQDGYFEIYKHIERAIGTSAGLTNVEKEKLWQAFRNAIIKLGFVASPRVSGTHYMAEEYLRQVGVPLAFADDLAEKMLNFAKHVGLPDVDDPEAVVSWQNSLESRLGVPFSVTAKKAVALDTQGYYTRVFLAVYAAGGMVGPEANALEKAMAKAFASQNGASSFRRAVLPYPMLYDGNLGIFVPSGDDREFEVRVDDDVQTIRSGAEDKIMAVTIALANEIVIKEIRSNQSTKYQLWEDGRSNRLLIFSDSGRFKVSTQIGNPPNELYLSPGHYQCLSRFCPEEIDAETVRDEPQQYLFPLTVLPGQVTKIANGPASLNIEGENQPLATWEGSKKATKEGIEFYYDNLSVNIQLPTEWLAASGKSYVLDISVSGISKHIEVPLELGDNGCSVIRIADEFEQRGWIAGFGRLLVELRRQGEARSLLRSAIYFWYGLKGISRELRFDCNEMPANLEQALCENVKISGQSIIPGGLMSRTIRLAFKVDETRTQSLTWNVPGIYVEVETTSDKAPPQRQSVPVGSIEVISPISPKHVLISASDPGELCLGDWTQSVDFSRTPTKRIAAALLCDHITPHSNKLIYRNGVSGVEIELLSLVQPHTVEYVKSRVSDGLLKVSIGLPKRLEALALRAQDILTGMDIEATVEANEGKWTSSRFGRAQLICADREAGGEAVELLLDLEMWPAGAWLFRFDGRIGGIWGHLENARQDQFAVGLLCDEQGVPVSERRVLTDLPGLTDKEAGEVLARVGDVLRNCYAESVWPSIKWLADAWRALVSRLKNAEQTSLRQMIALAALKPPDDASPSWMLQQTIGSSLPGIFCWPADAYRSVDASKHPLPRALSTLARLDANYPRVFPDILHSAVATGYNNFPAVNQGARPDGFHMGRYCEGISQMEAKENFYRLDDDNYLPTGGDTLGPLHYRFAMRQLEDAYKRGLAGNEVRRGQAIGMCNHIYRQLPTLTSRDAQRLNGVSPHIAPWPEEVAMLSDEEAQRKENLTKFAHTLSWYAYHCRLESKVKGSLENFHMKLRASGSPVENSLAYLLQVGGELFGFYLVLWEVVIRAECIGG